MFQKGFIFRDDGFVPYDVLYILILLRTGFMKHKEKVQQRDN